MTWQKATLTFLLVAYLLATYLAYSTYIQGDFSIYFQAGERVRRGSSLYLLEENLYVYGPLLANLISPFTIFDQLVISRLWMVSSILATLTASWLFYRTYLTKFGMNGLIALTGILILGFAFRNNLGNGNVMAFVLLCVTIAIRIAPSSSSIASSVVLSLVTIFVFEVKTYISLFLIAFLFMNRRYQAIGFSIIFALFFNLIYLINSSSNYLEWFEALKVRSTGLQSGSDQATILVFTNRLVPDSILIGNALAFAIYLVIFYILFARLKATKERNLSSALILFSAAPILTIFSHGQDFILSNLVLGYLILQQELNPKKSALFQINLWIAIGLLVNWTNESLPQALLIAFCLMLMLRNTIAMELKSILVSSSIFLLSTVINLFLHSLEGDIQYLAYNFQALLFGLSSLAAILHIEKSKIAHSHTR